MVKVLFNTLGGMASARGSVGVEPSVARFECDNVLYVGKAVLAPIDHVVGGIVVQLCEFGKRVYSAGLYAGIVF